MGIQFVNYMEPTNTAPAALAAWDEARGDDEATEVFINQMAAELQAMAVRSVRLQRQLVARDAAIQMNETVRAAETAPLTRWGHFLAAIFPLH